MLLSYSCEKDNRQGIIDNRYLKMTEFYRLHHQCQRWYRLLGFILKEILQFGNCIIWELFWWLGHHVMLYTRYESNYPFNLPWFSEMLRSFCTKFNIWERYLTNSSMSIELFSLASETDLKTIWYQLTFNNLLLASLRKWIAG